MKNMGVDGLVSSNDLSNSTVLFSTYFAPSFSSIKALKNKYNLNHRTKKHQYAGKDIQEILTK